MMNVDPFWLNDRIVPSDANDPKEVTRLGQALSDVGEDVADRSRPAVTEAVRRFQDSRGLRVDGEAQVNGPTAQRLAAERHERQTAARPSAQQRILGEQHSVPVRDAVGTGGRNRPEDRRSVMQALAIGNYLSRYAALNPVDLPPGAPDPELETALARFRRKQGVRETGPLAPGSLTLRLLNQITAPRLHQLIGDDVASPRDMSPAEDPAVVRDSPDSPTARAVPFRDEGQVAHETAQDQEIARRQADRIRQEMAAVDRGEAAASGNMSLKGFDRHWKQTEIHIAFRNVDGQSFGNRHGLHRTRKFVDQPVSYNCLGLDLTGTYMRLIKEISLAAFLPDLVNALRRPCEGPAGHFVDPCLVTGNLCSRVEFRILETEVTRARTVRAPCSGIGVLEIKPILDPGHGCLMPYPDQLLCNLADLRFRPDHERPIEAGRPRIFQKRDLGEIHVR